MAKKLSKESSLFSFSGLRAALITGFLISGPIGITIYLAWALVKWIDGLVKPIIPDRYNPDTYLTFSIPGFGVLVAVIAIIIIGYLTQIFGRLSFARGRERVTNAISRVVKKMPLIGNVYGGLRQIFETILDKRGDSFTKAGIIEYPRKGVFAIVFISTIARDDMLDKLPNCSGDDRYISVFLPTTPNPTSGFLLFVRESEITYLDMTVEDAAKLVISAGLVYPEKESQSELNQTLKKIKAGQQHAAKNIPEDKKN